MLDEFDEFDAVEGFDVLDDGSAAWATPAPASKPTKATPNIGMRVAFDFFMSPSIFVDMQDAVDFRLDFSHRRQRIS
ncbi:hypothetical protein [Paraburkholderia sp. Ac-20347]|uniref:hypothetical protein n=1 Tax=Paraburkholderia sp. Ac-20347 TaxID=2703892 RepID=UPI001F124A48|nr:hypothetical protein [Paraburkholderia sp. Ac-20347]